MTSINKKPDPKHYVVYGSNDGKTINGVYQYLGHDNWGHRWLEYYPDLDTYIDRNNYGFLLIVVTVDQVIGH